MPIAVVAALSLGALRSSTLREKSFDMYPSSIREMVMTSSISEQMAESPLEEMIEDEQEFQRRYGEDSLSENEGEGEEDYDAAASAGEAPPQDEALAAEEPLEGPIAPYTLDDTLIESDIFEDTFAIILFDPSEDKFIALYNKRHRWKNATKNLWSTMKYLVYMLRKTFPDRFTKDSPELALAVGAGDYPHVKARRMPHDGVAPVMMFGSAFSHPKTYVNMIVMPHPDNHYLYCLEEWMSHSQICKEMQPAVRGEKEGLIFGEDYGLEWENLIPQVIWRGIDFSYIPTISRRSDFIGSPNPATFFSSLSQEGNKRHNAMVALNNNYFKLLPRWKGAALTAKAELEAGGGLPWANIKMSSHREVKKWSATVGSPKYELWESVGIGVGRGKSLPELAKYKYHIDLGYGGGTAKSGTIEKLAMPGLLFHHVTPMKDCIHDRMQPWRHYIPVSHSLRDLKKKFDWAESHPHQAKRIANQGTEFIRHFGTPEGMEQMFQEDFVEPLRMVIEAYRPVTSSHPGVASWRDVIDSSKVMPVMECSGYVLEGGCRFVGGEEVLEWQRTTWYNAS